MPRQLRAFSLLEMLLALAIFTISAVSLAQALNQISVYTLESIDESEVRESIRSVFEEISVSQNLVTETRRTDPNASGISFQIETSATELRGADGTVLNGLFEVTVTAFRENGNSSPTQIDSATTLINPQLQ